MEMLIIFIGGTIFFLMFAIALRKYIKHILMDAVDLVLSGLDLLLWGIGSVGGDIGDLVASIIIFKKEKKVLGTFMAVIVFWEATGWTPVNFIPVVGEIVEWIFNFFPAVTLGRIFFSKEKDALKEQKRSEENLEAAKKLGIGTWFEKGKVKKLQSLIKNENFVDAVKIGKKNNKKFGQKIKNAIDKLDREEIKEIKGLLNSNLQAPPEIISILQKGINQAEEHVKKARKAEGEEDYKTAAENITYAKKTLSQAIKSYNSSYSNMQQ